MLGHCTFPRNLPTKGVRVADCARREERAPPRCHVIVTRQGGVFPTSLGELSLADPVIPDFWSPKQGADTLLFRTTCFCHRGLGNGPTAGSVAVVGSRASAPSYGSRDALFSSTVCTWARLSCGTCVVPGPGHAQGHLCRTARAQGCGLRPAPLRVSCPL